MGRPRLFQRQNYQQSIGHRSTYNDDNPRDFSALSWPGSISFCSAMYMVCCVNMTRRICYWYSYIPNKPKLTRKSEDAVNSDHVLNFCMMPQRDIVRHAVQASMRSKSYDVQVRRLLIFCISSSLRNKSLEYYEV
jgi:hypothetical protein